MAACAPALCDLPAPNDILRGGRSKARYRQSNNVTGNPEHEASPEYQTGLRFSSSARRIAIFDAGGPNPGRLLRNSIPGGSSSMRLPCPASASQILP
jgi:hypothetical protein